MKAVLRILACMLGATLLSFAEQVVSLPARGELQVMGEKVVFVPASDSISKRISGPDLWVVSGGGALLDAKLQAAKPHRPNERIMLGAIGNYNIGLLAPCIGVSIFIAVGGQRPRLVGITDANGRFAVRLPPHDKGAEVFIFFNGEVEIMNLPIPGSQSDMRLVGRSLSDRDQVLVLKTGSSSVRYRVSVPML